MQQDSSTNADNNIFKVTPEYKPKTKEEASERAAYLTSALGIACAQTTRDFIRSCQNGTFGERLQQATLRPFSDHQFMSAIKELTCISIYLTTLDQGGEAAESWLIEFLFTSLRITDNLSRGTPAREIMQVHEFVAGADDICREGSISVLQTLGLGNQTQEAIGALEKYFKTSKQYRAALLQYALSQPLETLSRHIESLS